MHKSVLTVLSVITGAAVGAGAVGKVKGDSLAKAKDLSSKHLALFRMMDQWVRVKQEGKNLTSYFEKNNFRKIAIYGMSYAGMTLLNELKETDTEIAYGIDKNSESICSDIDIISMDEKLEEVDAIVVTAITFYEEIEEELSKKVDCPILSLEDILYEV